MTGEKKKECVHRTQMPLLPAQVNRYFFRQIKETKCGMDRRTDIQTDGQTWDKLNFSAT
jgi:hypothetical protein